MISSSPLRGVVPALKARAAKLGAAVAVAALSAGPVLAQSSDPQDPIAAVKLLQGSSTGMGPVMWGLAAAVVGILVGVKWIKRGRGAA